MSADPDAAPRIGIEGPRCPFCHESLLAEHLKWGCPACMAWQHAACLSENRARCAACGAPAPRPTAEPSPGQPVRPELVERVRRTSPPAAQPTGADPPVASAPPEPASLGNAAPLACSLLVLLVGAAGVVGGLETLVGLLGGAGVLLVLLALSRARLRAPLHRQRAGLGSEAPAHPASPRPPEDASPGEAQAHEEDRDPPGRLLERT